MVFDVGAIRVGPTVLAKNLTRAIVDTRRLVARAATVVRGAAIVHPDDDISEAGLVFSVGDHGHHGVPDVARSEVPELGVTIDICSDYPTGAFDLFRSFKVPTSGNTQFVAQVQNGVANYVGPGGAFKVRVMSFGAVKRSGAAQGAFRLRTDLAKATVNVSP